MSKANSLNIGKITYPQIRQLLAEPISLKLPGSCKKNIRASLNTLQELLKQDRPIYGVNTGFGLLANTKIPKQQLGELQRRLVLSHATGTGDYLSDTTVRLILALKINGLASGYSGVRLELVEALIALFNHEIYPCIPGKGSVGASGDLAPLAHLSCPLIGAGFVRYQNKILSAAAGLKIAKLKPLQLGPKEGLALLNGTQVSTALALHALTIVENIFMAALIAGSMAVDAAKGSDTPFDERISRVRGQPGQIIVASLYRQLLKGSQIRASHVDCERVQDPYSLRCQPQVMGACLDTLKYVGNTLLREANGISENPLVFAEQQEILSGGNFHAEPVAMAADTMALAIAEIGALSERRIALLIDPHFSELPAFLVEEGGINSGFMIAQVTAAALASENKSLAHPACVDSIPTSANQEDHVSMATFAARRLHEMADNTATIIAIELLATCQAVDLRKPLKTSPLLQKVHALVRQHVAFYSEDRFFAPDIEVIKQLVKQGRFNQFLKGGLSIA